MSNHKKNLKFVIILCFLFLSLKFELIISVLFYRTNSKDKSKNVALCAIGKNENNYIKEFINYYKDLGIKKIFIYDNNEINSEKFEDVIQNEINSGFVKLINMRGKRIAQIDSYEDCLSRNRYKYDFLLFFDIDEFLYIQDNHTLNSFLSHPRYKNCQTIKINWLCYGDNEILYYEKGDLQKRFTKKSNAKACNIQTKSIIKIKYNNKISWGEGGAHKPGNNVKKACDSLGNPIHFSIWQIDPPLYKYVYLKHYLTKSTEEYARKMIRGDNAYLRNNGSEFYQRALFRYFRVNNFSMQKLSIFEKSLNISLRKYILKCFFQLKT